jgi:hypothetical protein
LLEYLIKFLLLIPRVGGFLGDEGGGAGTIIHAMLQENIQIDKLYSKNDSVRAAISHRQDNPGSVSLTRAILEEPWFNK